MRKCWLTGIGALVAVGVAVTVRVAWAAPRTSPDPKSLGVNLKTFDSPIYIVYTDVEDDDAREAVMRMNKVATEYHERTKALFSGQITQPLPFYLFSKQEDYLKASGMPGSAGVFTGDALMARVIRDKDGHIGYRTWHVAQHEGFHQFVFAVIRGEIPTWVNEGLAEYFGESVFTGDSMVTGVIPGGRLKRIQKSIEDNRFASINVMMTMSHRQWNSKLDITNYDQAWSMAHFLAMGDNGKYQDAFARFLQLVGKGNPWERAWADSFGSVEGFEQKWKDYWTKMPDNPTIDLYAKAAVSSLTSFMGRAFTQKQTFDSFDEFMKREPKDLKAAKGDWLPPGLYTDMREMAKQLQSGGAEISIIQGAGNSPLPKLVCVLKDGTRITGTFFISNGRIGKVNAEITNKPEAAKPAAKGGK